MALFVTAGLIRYALLGLLLILVIAKSSIRKWIIGISILILIPTWDFIIGYPIFLYLCKYKSGMNIYKSVENVEGFYVGENSFQHLYSLKTALHTASSGVLV